MSAESPCGEPPAPTRGVGVVGWQLAGKKKPAPDPVKTQHGRA